MIDETVGALLGHDGFGPEEGKGSFPHYLHHAKYEVNYGEFCLGALAVIGLLTFARSDFRQNCDFSPCR